MKLNTLGLIISLLPSTEDVDKLADKGTDAVFIF